MMEEPKTIKETTEEGKISPGSHVTEISDRPSSHVTEISGACSEMDLIEDKKNKPPKEGNVISRAIICVREFLSEHLASNSVLYWLLFKTFLNVCLIAYTVAAVYHWYQSGQKKLDWCKGNGLLLLLLIFIASSVIYYKVLSPLLYTNFSDKSTSTSTGIAGKIYRILKKIFICVAIIGIVVFLLIDTAESRRRLISAGGLLVFILLGFIFSKHPNQVKWKIVVTGILIQTLLGIIIIRWEIGRAIFLCIGERVNVFLSFAHDGAAFVYGDFIVTKLQVFAFQALSVIYFLSMIIEILFYFGWMQTICYKLGSIVQMVLGTTIIESVNAVTSVFLGLSEAPLLYKPYIKDLTSSEMHAVMAGGFSTAAGTVFAAYTALGVNPAYIITASVMAAPTALYFAKLLYPETEVTKTSTKTFVPYKSEEKNVIDAACKGALSATNLVMGITAIVLACVSFVAFLDSLLNWLASRIGIEDFSFEYLVGKLLLPIPYIMGVAPDQCEYVARLIGIKITLNEFIAYKELGNLRKAKVLTPRAEAMASFALCSFSNPGGLGSFLALLVSLCPSQKERVSRVAIRAFISGITTGLLTATVAGALMPEEGFSECASCVTTLAPNTTLSII